MTTLFRINACGHLWFISGGNFSKTGPGRLSEEELRVSFDLVSSRVILCVSDVFVFLLRLTYHYARVNVHIT